MGKTLSQRVTALESKGVTRKDVDKLRADLLAEMESNKKPLREAFQTGGVIVAVAASVIAGLANWAKLKEAFFYSEDLRLFPAGETYYRFGRPYNTMTEGATEVYQHFQLINLGSKAVTIRGLDPAFGYIGDHVGVTIQPDNGYIITTTCIPFNGVGGLELPPFRYQLQVATGREQRDYEPRYSAASYFRSKPFLTQLLSAEIDGEEATSPNWGSEEAIRDAILNWTEPQKVPGACIGGPPEDIVDLVERRRK